MLAGRIFEIYEGSAHSVNGLQLLVQTHLLAAVEYFVCEEEARLSSCKEEYKKFDFNFISYCQDQMKMSRLYNSLGVLEQVLAKFDELDALLSLIVASFSSGSGPKWITEKRFCIGEGCPLLSALMLCDSPHSSMSLIEMRCLILAHQILVSMWIYDERVRLATENAPPNVLQMKSDFAVALLRYAVRCIWSVCENISALKLEVSHEEFQCWTIAFCIETMQFVGLLTEATHVENAAHFLCSLAVRKCNAMAELYKSIKSKEESKLIVWFEKGITTIDFSDKWSSAVSELRQILSDMQQFSHFMQKYHESSIALLKHFRWKRQARLLGFQLANYLLTTDRMEGALPYLLKFISGLIRDGSSSVLLQKTLLIAVKHLEVSSDLYFKELVDFYLILTLQSENERDCISFCSKLFKLLQHSSGNIRQQCRNMQFYCPIDVHLEATEPVVLAAPGDVLHLSVNVNSKLPMTVSKYNVRCIFTQIDTTGSILQKTNTGYKPQFECSYDSISGINRFGCISKGDFAVTKDSTNQTEIGSDREDEECVQNQLVFTRQEANCDKLCSGQTELELIARAPDSGIYILDHVEVEILDYLCVWFSWADISEIERDASRRLIFCIHRKAPSVKLKQPNGSHLLSGVPQCVEFELCCGSEQASDCRWDLQIDFIGDRNNTFDFWDDLESKWRQSCVLPVEKMLPSQNRTVRVYVCHFLRNLISRSSDTDEVTVQEVNVKWLECSWKFSLIFHPLITVKCVVSLLEDKVLFEMQISRSQNDDQWILTPQEAILLRRGEEPKIPAKLLNPKLTEIRPVSSYRIVWIVSSRKRPETMEEEHRVKIVYRVRYLEESANDIPVKCLDRIYVYEDNAVIANQKACYELCAQLLSSQPGAVLCRVDNACDLIVSLRSLTNRVETVIISIDADPHFWAVNEKNKLLCVKESGLGQTSFSVVPKLVGFLPYPSVSVFACHHQRKSSDKSVSSRCEESDFGPRLPSFIRSQGKQVHVLGSFSPTADQKSTSSEKSGRLKEAKTRLTKLFD